MVSMTIAKKRKTAPRKTSKTPAPDGADLVTITVNVPRQMLARIDQAAENEGLNRTAFMISSAAERVRKIEAGPAQS